MAELAAVIETEGYKGPDRRTPPPLRAYDKTIVNSEARLPPISDLGRGIVALVVNNMAPKEVAALAMHLTHTCREASIKESREAAEGGTVAKGDLVQLVRVATVSQKYEGLAGVVQQVSKVRCYVKVKGHSRPFYVYMSEVQKVSPSTYKKLTGIDVANDGGSRKKSSSTTKASAKGKSSGKKGSSTKTSSTKPPKKATTRKVAEEAAPADEKAA